MGARRCAALFLGVAVWNLCSTLANAQAAPPTAAESNARDVHAKPAPPTAAPAAEDDEQAHPNHESMGGMPDEAQGEDYESPVKTLGVGMGGSSYVLSAGAGLIYLIAVYPLQALFGSSKVEPVMLWMLLPIIGPWMAQYEHSVRDKPVWRGVLIGDAALQATGLVLGLIGAALSGRRAPSSQHSGLDLHLGVAGGGAIGLTVSLRTM
jgi:hypothetical protein